MQDRGIKRSSFRRLWQRLFVQVDQVAKCMNQMSFDLPPIGRDPINKLSQVLEELAQGSEARVSLGDLIGALGEQGFVPLMILFSLPNVFFFVPGSSVITGLPLMFIALQMLMGRPAVWLPRVLSEQSLGRDVFRRIVGHALPWILWVEKLVRPRYWPLSRRVAEGTVGAVSLVMATFMFLPIPFANSLPAVSVIVLALALGERDGLWLIGGTITSLISVGIVVAIFAAGTFAMLSFF